MPESPDFSPTPFTPLEAEKIFTHLTPLEHAMFGSSININGQNMGAVEIIRRGPDFFLRPIGTLTGTTMDIRVIAEERHHKTLEGIEIFERYIKGYRSRLYLPGLYQDGTIQAEFGFELINNETNEVIGSEEMGQVLSRTNKELIEELRDILHLKIYLSTDPSDKAFLSLDLKTPYENDPYGVNTIS